MIKLKYTIIAYLSGIAMLCYNCTEPVDFSQSEDLELFPVVETSLVFFEAPAPEFITQNNEDFSVSDFIEISFFNDEFVEESLIKADFVFDIENSINRAFRLDITFVDEEGTALEVFIVEVPASPNNQNRITNFVQTYEGEALERVKQSTSLEFDLMLLGGETIEEDAPGRIDVKSSAIFSLMIDTN